MIAKPDRFTLLMLIAALWAIAAIVYGMSGVRASHSAETLGALHVTGDLTIDGSLVFKEGGPRLTHSVVSGYDRITLIAPNTVGNRNAASFIAPDVRLNTFTNTDVNEVFMAARVKDPFDTEAGWTLVGVNRNVKFNLYASGPQPYFSCFETEGGTGAADSSGRLCNVVTSQSPKIAEWQIYAMRSGLSVKVVTHP